MNKALTVLTIALFSIFTFASDVKHNLKIANILVNDVKAMAFIDNEIKSLLPELRMKLIDISVNASPTRFSAVVTYADTAKGTFFKPAFGKCSLFVQGKIINNSSVSVESVKENDCGE